MGEFALFGKEEIKIGTCEDMYYLRANQRGSVGYIPGNVNVNSTDALSIRFRFPWPDEDHILPGGFGTDFERSIAVDAPMPDGVGHNKVQFVAQAGYLCSLPCPEGVEKMRVFEIIDGHAVNEHPLVIHRNGFSGHVKLVQQKLLADGRLVPVLMCGGCRAKWRCEDPAEIELIAKALEAEGDQRRNEIARRIRTGAKLA